MALLVAERGGRGAERFLGVGRGALLAVAAGAPCLAGTVALIQQRLAATDDERDGAAAPKEAR